MNFLIDTMIKVAVFDRDWETLIPQSYVIL